MKKLIAILLAMVLALGCAVCLAEEEQNVIFRPALLNQSGLSAEKWMESGINRAVLTVMLWLETSSEEEAESKLAYSSFNAGEALIQSYVGINEEGYLFVMMYDDNAILAWMYSVEAGIAAAFRTESASGKVVSETALDQSCVTWKANESDDITSAVTAITAALKESGS